jgi:uncharacterized protein (TIGR02598 family)
MKHAHGTEGFSLVEVALALAIAVFCLVTIVALLPVGLVSARATTGETASNGILDEVIADLRAAGPTSPPGGSTTSPVFGITIPASGTASQSVLYFTPEGASSTTLTPTSRYKLTVVFPATTGGKAATVAVARFSWPAQAATPSGVVESFVALDRN